MKLALPVLVGNSRESRGGCGSWKPSGCADPGVVVVEAGDDRGDARRGCGRSRRRTSSHGTGWSGPSSVRASWQTIATSLRSSVARRAAGCRATGAPSTSNPRRTTCCLPPAWTSRSVRPSDGRISARRAVHDVGAVQLRRDLHGQRAAAQRGLGDRRCRGWPTTKLPPMPMNTLASPSRIARIASTVSKPCSRGAGEAELARRARRGTSSGIFSQMPIVRSPCTLEWPRTGHTPGAGLADHAAQQQQVDDLADRRHRVLVLGEAHRPADDRALGRRSACCATRSSLRRGRCPVACEHACRDRPRATCVGVLVEARAVRRSMKSRSSTVPGARSSASSSSRPSAWNSAMSPPSRICRNSSAIGDAVADHAVHLLRVLEPHQPGLGQRVDRDDLGAVAPSPSPARRACAGGWCPGSGRR